ncbi:MAG: DegV family protein [Firmicutes bacterium]|nr:DegV family protein [Bacillota bacterium]
MNKKNNIVFFHDTDSELWHTLAKEQNIDKTVLRMPWTVDGTVYLADMGEEFNPDWFYGLMAVGGKMPTTIALNPEDYKEAFEPYLKEGKEIFYVSFSSELSGTFQSLQIALNELKETYPNLKFTRFDTKSISLGGGIQVYEGAKLWNEGKSVKEMTEFLEGFSKKVNLAFVANDLNHLKRGGRISAVKAAIGGLLNIKPIIKMSKDGKLFPADKASGKNKAYTLIANEVAERIKDTDKYPLWLLDANCKEDADYLQELLTERIPNIKIERQIIGPVIGAHCGPNTIGVCYVGMERE